MVGIVASRVLQEFYRPTVIFGGDGQNWRGSGRSIEGFDLAAALRGCEELLLRHGGHAMAAGLSIHSEKVDLLRERLNGLAQAALRPEQLQPCLKLDAEVASSELGVEQIEELERLAPMGQGNPAVRLALRGLSHRMPPRPMGRDNQHVKLSLTERAFRSAYFGRRWLWIPAAAMNGCNSSIKRANPSKVSCCAPSLQASAGLGWTSINRPSAPMAAAPLHMETTRSARPAPWLGSMMMGQCDSFLMIGMVERSSVLRV